MDFEKAAHTAAVTAFPGVNIVGCHFHIGQNVWRRLQMVSLQQDYLANVNDIRLTVKMLTGLAFLPLADVIRGFELLCQDIRVEWRPLFEYFEKVYIGKVVCGVRCGAMFPPETWNLNSRVINELPRTNNSVEAWHRVFSENVACSNPNVFRFMEALKKEQSIHEVNAVRIEQGDDIRKDRKYYVRKERNILKLVTKHNRQSWHSDFHIREFLKGIAANTRLTYVN
jgi:hypothetical protein